MIELILLCLLVILKVPDFYIVWRWKKRQELLLSHIVSRADDLEAKMVILGKVLKIFEEETQILQRRNEQTAVKQRFRQTR